MVMGEKPSFEANRLVELCRWHGVVRLSLFGSVARGEAGEESDVDLLVEFSRRISLLQFVALERQLSEILGKKVDLLTREGISPYLWEKIQRDLQVVYEAR